MGPSGLGKGLAVHATDRIIHRPAGLDAPGKPRRILHVVPSLERGGIDVWLMRMLRQIDRMRFPMDFLVLNEAAGALAPEARALGSRVHLCRHARRPWTLQRRFLRLMREHGPYEVVHSHVHHKGGLVLRLAAWYGVPIRVAHSHSDTRAAETGASWLRRVYLMTMGRWIVRYATHRIAVSRSAAEDLFGSHGIRNSGCEIVPCGIDLAAFADGAVSRGAARKTVGLGEDALVIGHVGRFLWAKNHKFLVEVAAALFRREPRARLLLVGNGPLRPEIEALARALAIADRVIFAGARADVPRLLMGAMDVFVFPSRYEGLGLAVVEAQAAGLPCVLASTVPPEADVVPALIHRLPLEAPAEVWAERILNAVAAPRPGREQALAAVQASAFDIQRSVDHLQAIYTMAAAN
jgi:glycosyltransferase involved in cell wall biosynthesis